MPPYYPSFTLLSYTMVCPCQSRPETEPLNYVIHSLLEKNGVKNSGRFYIKNLAQPFTVFF